MEEVGIRLSVKDRRAAAAALQATEKDFDHLGDAAEEAGKQAETSGKRFERTRGVLSGIGRVGIGAVKILTGVGIAGAAVGLKTAAAMQTAKIGFTTMLGSGKAASRFLRDLSAFAAKTPFEFPELQTAASRLVSAGIETKKVIPIMTTLGDVTAGMGTGSEGITRATNAIQQMTAAGRISAEDLNQLRDAGIPVFDLLAAATGRTKEEIIALKDEGKLGGKELELMMKALETGKGLEKFNGLMAKQSGSLEGQMSTLKDTVNMGLADAVKPAIPLIGRLLGLATDFAKDAMPRIRDGVETGVTAARRFIKGWKGGGGMEGALATMSAPGVSSNLGQIGDAVGKVADAIATADWKAIKEGLGEGTADTISVAGVAIGFLADHVDTLAKYLPLLVVAFAAYKTTQAASNVISLAAIPLTVAQIVANLSLASSNRALAAATATTTVAQRGLNLAMLANPLGLIVVGIMLVVGAFYLLYTRSEKFRGMIDVLWGLLKPFGKWIGGILVDYILFMASAWLRMAEYGIMGFRLLLTAAFKAFDGILSAAEAGLGWIPGLGDKISGARAAFDKFGDGVIAKLERVEDKIRTARGEIDKLAQDRSSTITIATVYTSRSRGKEASMGIGAGIPGVANGGHVQSGRPYIIGERRAELFIPSVSGRIMPRVPDSPADLEDIDPGAFAGTGGGHGGPRIVQIQLDRRTIAEALIDEVDDAEART